MVRLNHRTVQLTYQESVASDLFEDKLSAGQDIPTAVAHVKAVYPHLSPAFYEYLGS